MASNQELTEPEFNFQKYKTVRAMNHLIARYSNQSGISQNALGNFVAFSILAEHLAQSKNFYVKGGAGLNLRLGFKYRTTKDLDLVFTEPSDQIDRNLRQCLSSGEKFSFLVTHIETRQATSGASIHKFRIQISIANKPFRSVPVEVVASEFLGTNTAESIATDLTHNEEHFRVINLGFQFAEKLHRITSSVGSAKYASDLFDLCVISSLLDDSEKVKLRETVDFVFEARATHDFQPPLSALRGFEAEFGSLIAIYGMFLNDGIKSIEDAVDYINRTLNLR